MELTVHSTRFDSRVLNLRLFFVNTTDHNIKVRGGNFFSADMRDMMDIFVWYVNCVFYLYPNLTRSSAY